MEERILDEEEGRSIKVKRTKEGAIEDVVDALAAEAAEGGEETEEEIVLDIPEEGEEYDEDLVGLTPEQLKRERERREKAAEEARKKCEELTLEGEARLQSEDFEGAVPFFAQALVYEPEDLRAGKGYWIAKTENFTIPELFYDEDVALEAAQAPEEVREFLLSHIEEGLIADRKTLLKEQEPLVEVVEAGKEKRRGAFLANRKYYRVRMLAVAALFVAMIVGCIVSATFIVKTTSLLPVILTACFGGAGVLLLIVGLLVGRKLILASRLVRDNERLSSTEDGKKLLAIQKKLALISEILGDEENTEAE